MQSSEPVNDFHLASLEHCVTQPDVIHEVPFAERDWHPPAISPWHAFDCQPYDANTGVMHH